VCLDGKFGFECHGFGGSAGSSRDLPLFDGLVFTATESKVGIVLASNSTASNSTGMASADTDALRIAASQHRSQVPNADGSILGARNQSSAGAVGIESKNGIGMAEESLRAIERTLIEDSNLTAGGIEA
jgi:hypothetical protein